MRVLACTMLAIAAIAVPARAQTYDPGYPVCLQVYTVDGDHIECRYSTLAQCQASASGRGGTSMLHQSVFRAGRQETAGPGRPSATARLLDGRWIGLRRKPHIQFCRRDRFPL